jgi:hypothetical protein
MCMQLHGLIDLEESPTSGTMRSTIPGKPYCKAWCDWNVALSRWHHGQPVQPASLEFTKDSTIIDQCGTAWARMSHRFASTACSCRTAPCFAMHVIWTQTGLGHQLPFTRLVFDASCCGQNDLCCVASSDLASTLAPSVWVLF